MASAFPMARFSAGALSFRSGMDSERWSSNQKHTLSLSLSHVTDTQGKEGRGKLGGNNSLAFSFNSALESTKRVQSIMVQSELTRGVLVFLLFSFRVILIRYPLSSWKWFSCKTLPLCCFSAALARLLLLHTSGCACSGKVTLESVFFVAPGRGAGV